MDKHARYIGIWKEESKMENIINETIKYIKGIFEHDYSGHDFFHSLRVYKTAVEIAKYENANIYLVSLAALLHDVDDIKLSPKTHNKKDNAVAFMKKMNISQKDISTICEIIDSVSFKGFDTIKPSSIEAKCVQDADRLDALGAIGIARAFAYGGNHNRPIYDPDIKPIEEIGKEEYQNNTSTTINHFYEKLFKLKELMNTEYGTKIAVQREDFMRMFIKEFMLEWNGDNN